MQCYRCMFYPRNKYQPNHCCFEKLTLAGASLSIEIEIGRKRERDVTLDLSSGVYQPYTAYAVHVSSELVIGSIFRRFGFTTLRYVFFYL